MSNKPVLVLKDIQTLQTVGASKRPSFMGMLRTAVTGRDAQGDKVGRMRRLGNALGVGAKTVAGGAAALQAAHSMQGGNLAAPLQIGQMYEGLDPTGSFSQGYNENFGEGDSIRQRRNTADRAQRQFQAQYGPQQITAPVPVSSAVSTSVPLPTQDGTANTAYTGTAPTTAPAIPQSNATLQTLANDPDAIRRLAMGMSGNPPQQPGPTMPTQAPPAVVPQSVVGHTAGTYSDATGRPMQTPGGPAVPQQASSVQRQLPIIPSGPQGALPPDPNSPAQQRGPPTHQQSQFNPQQPLDPRMFSTNPSDARAYAAYQNLEHTSQYPQLQTSHDFVHDLFDTMGTYLYKMTPEEAGAFAVDAYFKLRE
jgi:hypothetical protein